MTYPLELNAISTSNNDRIFLEFDFELIFLPYRFVKNKKVFYHQCYYFNFCDIMVFLNF